MLWKCLKLITVFGTIRPFTEFQVTDIFLRNRKDGGTALDLTKKYCFDIFRIQMKLFANKKYIIN